jgi:hypothetical protein
MNDQTQNKIKLLTDSDLFTHVGQKDVGDWKYAKSWMDAMAHSVSASWSNALIEGLNVLSDGVLSRSNEAYQHWHSFDTEIRPVVLDLAKEKTKLLMQSQGLPDTFMYTVFAGFLGIAMEAQYADLVGPGFYSTVVLDVFLKGHYPCGWKGEFPEGKLVVY